MNEKIYDIFYTLRYVKFSYVIMRRSWQKVQGETQGINLFNIRKWDFNMRLICVINLIKQIVINQDLKKRMIGD